MRALRDRFPPRPTYANADDAAEAARITDHILSHPLVRELEADPRFHADHPLHKVPGAFRANNLTASTLIGPGLMAVAPFMWRDNQGKELVMILHAGKGLCGHPDIVHGGFVATVMDEALARCCFAALPLGVAMTAQLNIDYRAPTPADGYLVLRATTTRVEGRKAYVSGRLEVLPEPGSTGNTGSSSSEPGKLLAEGEALFICPKRTWVSFFSWGCFFLFLLTLLVSILPPSAISPFQVIVH